MRVLKAIVVLAVFGLAGLAGFAYFGDLTPELRSESRLIDPVAASDAD